MTAPDLDLQPAVEAAAQASYEAAVARDVRAGGDPLVYATWERLSPIIRNKYRQIVLPAVVASVPVLARQVWDLGVTAGQDSAHYAQAFNDVANPWVEDDDWDEALKSL